MSKILISDLLDALSEALQAREIYNQARDRVPDYTGQYRTEDFVQDELAAVAHAENRLMDELNGYIDQRIIEHAQT
jgi:hypothetical protein